MVVNFDVPMHAEDYVHRIGRTGRAEQRGKAYTFVTCDDQAMVREVEQRIGVSIPRRKVDGIGGIALPVQPHPSTRGRRRRYRRAS